jgi:hypothetical protein
MPRLLSNEPASIITRRWLPGFFVPRCAVYPTPKSIN